MKRQSAASLWSQLTTWYTQQIPEFADTLNPGALEEEIRELDEEVRRVTGTSLPSALVEIYKVNAGQKEFAVAGAFFGLPFLSPQDVLKQWLDWRSIADTDPELADEVVNTSYPRGAVRLQYMNPGHIPFSYDGAGNHLGIDLSPGPKGNVGQVINFGRDQDDRFVLADSLETFFVWILYQYYEGNYRISTLEDDGKVDRTIEISDPPYEHFLDAALILFGSSA